MNNVLLTITEFINSIPYVDVLFSFFSVFVLIGCLSYTLRNYKPTKYLWYCCIAFMLFEIVSSTTIPKYNCVMMIPDKITQPAFWLKSKKLEDQLNYQARLERQVFMAQNLEAKNLDKFKGKLQESSQQTNDLMDYVQGSIKVFHPKEYVALDEEEGYNTLLSEDGDIFFDWRSEFTNNQIKRVECSDQMNQKAVKYNELSLSYKEKGSL